MVKNDCAGINTDGSLIRAASPEQAGINSTAVSEMLDLWDKCGFQYHSLMIVRNGLVAAECYRFPFKKDSAHTMYSISKTITSTAVGFAVGEGLISLDTHLIDIFPEYRPKKDDNGYIDKITVKHLLTMMSGKSPNPLLNKTEKDWLKHLFGAKWSFEPGEKFEYVNENMYALCAILKKVTGQSVTDYLMPRLFEPLKIERPFWETDSKGIEAGGWGLFLKTEDLAKIMLCYHQKGRWNGKQVIAESWTAQATVNQHGKIPPVREAGYGYGIWIANENEYNAGGMFTQMGYILEKENCAVILTACSPTEDSYYKGLEILKAKGFIEPVPDAQANPGFNKLLSERVIDVVPFNTFRSPNEAEINGKVIHFKKNTALNLIGFPPGVLHLAAVYMSKQRAGNITDVTLNFNKSGLVLSWREGSESNSVNCPFNGEYEFSPITLSGTHFTAASTSFWEDARTLNVWIRPVESLCCRKLKFRFCGNGEVTLKLTSSPSIDSMLESVSGEIKNMLNGIKLGFITDGLLNKLKQLTEPVLKGKYKPKKRKQ